MSVFPIKRCVFVPSQMHCSGVISCKVTIFYYMYFLYVYYVVTANSHNKQITIIIRFYSHLPDVSDLSLVATVGN